MSVHCFVANESGAAMVDWVVITAALAALGLATTTIVGGGMEDLSTDVAVSLEEVIDSGFDLATAALTATSLWNDPNSTSREFANVDQLSFSSTIQFSADDEGIIFESGGTGRGIILYQHGGTLYLQAGAGGGFGEAAGRGEASWAVADGTHTIEGSMNADGGLALYVNGDLVDQSSFTAASLAGGNQGTIGGGASSVARNRGGFNQNSPGHPGVNEVQFYEGQTTGAELTPLG